MFSAAVATAATFATLCLVLELLEAANGRVQHGVEGVVVAASLL